MRTALYMRMSTDKQENSIDSQQGVLESYAKVHKMKIIDRYIDEGISGRTAEKRPAFMRMIDDSAKDIFDSVLIYDSSRFARNLEESIVYKSVLKKNNVELISATEPTLDADSALITDAMLGALNEMYSRKLSKAVKRGMLHQSKQGIYQVPPPYGYKKKDGKMWIDEEQAGVVRNIYEMFIEKPSYHSIVVNLNMKGIKNRRNNNWDIRGIRGVLTNQAYIGNVYYAGEIHKGVHEPIIDIDTWEKVLDLISKRPKTKMRAPHSYKHWLSGLLKCDYCGGRMCYTTNVDGCQSYRCSNNAKGLCNTSNQMSVKKIEKLALQTFLLLAGDEPIDYAFLVPKMPADSEIEILQASLKKIKTRLERHKAAYSAGVDTLEEYKINKEHCQKEEQNILKAIESLENTEISEEDIKMLRGAVTQLVILLFSEKRTMEDKCIAIRETVNKIIFNRDTGKFDVFYFI